MDEGISLHFIYRSKKKKSLKNISCDTKVADLIKKGLQLFDLPTTDISQQTYNILIGSTPLNKEEDLDKTIFQKGIEDGDNISIYNITEIILGKIFSSI